MYDKFVERRPRGGDGMTRRDCGTSGRDDEIHEYSLGRPVIRNYLNYLRL